jgi:hypothetical protein
MVKRALLLTPAVALLLVGCGGDDESNAQVRVYFLRDGKVWPVAREVKAATVPAAASVLIDGPTEQEQADLDVTTEVANEIVSRSGLAQIVFTMTQFATADAVEVDGDTYKRSDFEEKTPSVLVESPLPYEEVESPLRVTGTANTFEANFQYEVLDADGNVIDENFVTATSGTGTRGTFEFTTEDVDDAATLVVFESSAEDGSRIHEVEIPLSPAP